MKKKLLATAIAIGMLVPSIAFAQTSSLWKVLGNVLQPVLSTWSLRIPQLGSAGTPCVNVKNTSGDLGTTTCSGGGSTPAGSDTQIQYNNAGSFGASPDFKWENSSSTMRIAGNYMYAFGALKKSLRIVAPVELDLQDSEGGSVFIVDRVGFATFNTEDVIGQMAIGSGYANGFLAPTDGLIIQGKTGIGTTSPWRQLSVDNGDSDLGNNALAGSFTATSSTASVFPYASTTAISVSSLTSGNCVQASTGGLLTTVASPCGAGSGVTSVSGTWPIISSGGTTPIISFGGLSTSTPAVVGNIPYFSGVRTFANVATGTLAVSGPITVTAGQSIIGSGATIGCATCLTGTVGVANGGTGATTFGQGWIFSNGGTGALAASTSPTVNYITATSTTKASTFPYASTTAISSTGSAFFATSGGNVGIGTTSPYAALSVVGSTGVVADHYTATSTKVASTFPYASSTMITAITASTTNLSVNSVGGTQCLHSVNGVIQGIGADCFLGNITGSGGVNEVAYFTGGESLSSNGGLAYDGSTLTVSDLAAGTMENGFNVNSSGGSFDIYPLNIATTLFQIHNGLDLALNNVGECDGPTSALGTNGSTVVYCDTSLSDGRLKTNLLPLDSSALSKTLMLNPVNYHWNNAYLKTQTGKNTRNATTTEQVGLVAQEVQKIFPDVVSTTNENCGSSKCLSVDYAKLVPYLIQDIKTQQAEIDKLNKRLDQLTAGSSVGKE